MRLLVSTALSWLHTSQADQPVWLLEVDVRELVSENVLQSYSLNGTEPDCSE